MNRLEFVLKQYDNESSELLVTVHHSHSLSTGMILLTVEVFRIFELKMNTYVSHDER